MGVGSATLVFSTILFSHDLCQVFHTPILPICVRLESQSFFGRILMQHLLQGFYLQSTQLGAIATCPFVDQTLAVICSVGPTPFHQTSSATPCNLFDFFFRIAFSVETHSLIMYFCGRLFTYS